MKFAGIKEKFDTSRKRIQSTLKTADVRIAALPHSLPHRVLLEELAHQGRDVQDQDQILASDRAESEKTCNASDKTLTDKLHRADRSAVCLSGGGIRSASTCLGVLQGLSEYSTRYQNHPRPIPNPHDGVLQSLNFLSTVSGGGYTGSWMMAWAAHHPSGYQGVVDDLAKPGPTGIDPEPRPIRHLREYTSFLAPRLGGLTVDTWTLVATVLRNLFLNNCMLIPFVAALLCLPILVAAGVNKVAEFFLLAPQSLNSKVLAFVLFLSLLFATCSHLVAKRRKQVSVARIALSVSHFLVILTVFCLVAYWRVLNCQDIALKLNRQTITFFTWFVALPLFVPGAYGVWLTTRDRWRHRKKKSLFKAIWEILSLVRFLIAIPLVAIGTSTLLILLDPTASWLKSQLRQLPEFAYNWGGGTEWPEWAWVYVLGIPSVWAVLLTATSLFTGIVAKSDSEENREWWARMQAKHMIWMVIWFVTSVIAFYGPVFLDWTPAVLAMVLGSAAAFLGKSPKTSAAGGSSSLSFDQLALGLGILFLFFLGIALSKANYALSALTGQNILSHVVPAKTDGTLLGCLKQTLGSSANTLAWGLYALLLLLFAFLCNLFFRINTFSLHEMYRSRLMRAYLGASNQKRNPDFFTNFDENDNIGLAENRAQNGIVPDRKWPDAPIHVINATLNLIATNNTAWTQRKAESFTFSPLHCGSFRVGYVPTNRYAGSDGITLATAMAISGAAFNPNMGYHSSPILTLIMTLFNVRLGYWLPNPGVKGPLVIGSQWFFRRSSPRLALLPLINEALGNTNDTSSFIQLSDGGHFENLGLYEMVVRRCHRIVVVDGGADPKFELEDLGNAVRKIRIDLGIEIEFKDNNRIHTGNNTEALYCAVADIRYKKIDGPNATDGVLVFLKASVQGTESIDVQHYSATHPDFPNETTVNQFFNEAQFESYRKLGLTMVQTVAARSTNPNTDYTMQHFCDAATNYSRPAPPLSTQRIINQAKTFLKSGAVKVQVSSS